MTALNQLAMQLFDVMVNIDPKEFNAIAAAAARFKSEDQAAYTALMNGGCPEFATLFGAIERALNA